MRSSPHVDAAVSSTWARNIAAEVAWKQLDSLGDMTYHLKHLPEQMLTAYLPRQRVRSNWAHSLGVDGPLAAETGSDATGMVGISIECISSLHVRLMISELRAR
ncbi:hypothetical protein PSPO01_05072 [Paraphaeosphaeria sporulosa]